MQDDVSARDDLAWRPLVLDPSAAADRHRLHALIADGGVFRRHDTLEQQLRDLIAARHPGETLEPVALAALVRAELGAEPDRYGRWIFYPWSGRLVRALPVPAFRELRSDRNRNKITADEQRRLRRATIGIVGLSVGQASAVTLVLEGIGGRFRLADFDTLALSNLNRLRAGTHELGLNKAVLAARALFELDPYLEIEIFQQGLTDGSVGAFLGTGERRLDVLVEECDDLYAKLMVREQARTLGIPVVMDTNDRGLVDIERFDLEPDRPLLHGRIGTTDAAAIRDLEPPEKLRVLMRMIGEDTISPRLKSSMGEIRRTLSTWPQLASGVALGGALVTDAVRRLLLGELTGSGRYYVDIEAIAAESVERSR
jgi:molybdopterin/thiamine biosynthesis adenylyltransferase